ncbi:MAG: hypothetical protein LC751_12690 [Actinobacteria bacterium]|nr:hypothetical protein [Actinomycetota bacterium]
MNFLDLFIVLFVIFLAWRGARTGFLAGALSLVGVILGATLGSRFVSAFLERDGDLAVGSIITLASIMAFAVLGDALARAAGGYLSRTGDAIAAPYAGRLPARPHPSFPGARCRRRRAEPGHR